MITKKKIKKIEIIIDGKHSYCVNLQTSLHDYMIIAKLHLALMGSKTKLNKEQI